MLSNSNNYNSNSNIRPVNRIKEYLMKGDIKDAAGGADAEDFDALSLIEKQALCYRLLVERDKINERLRAVQESLDEK